MEHRGREPSHYNDLNTRAVPLEPGFHLLTRDFRVRHELQVRAVRRLLLRGGSLFDWSVSSDELC